VKAFVVLLLEKDEDTAMRETLIIFFAENARFLPALINHLIGLEFCKRIDRTQCAAGVK